MFLFMFMKKEKPISLSPSDIWIPFVISFQKMYTGIKAGLNTSEVMLS